jgi:hypothetical protein
MADEAAVRFVASLAAVMHPIKVGRDGARVTLDIPLTEQIEVMKLELMHDMAFEVTIRPIVQESSHGGGSKTDSRAARNPTDLAGS